MHETALREARRKKIPVVAFANVDANPDDIDYLVPGNDKAKKSIEWFFGKIEKAIEEGIALRPPAVPLKVRQRSWHLQERRRRSRQSGYVGQIVKAV